MPMKSAHGAEPATLACYCKKHLPVCDPLSLFTYANHLSYIQKEQLAAHEVTVAEFDRNNDANVSYSSTMARVLLHTLRRLILCTPLRKLTHMRKHTDLGDP